MAVLWAGDAPFERVKFLPLRSEAVLWALSCKRAQSLNGAHRCFLFLFLRLSSGIMQPQDLYIGQEPGLTGPLPSLWSTMSRLRVSAMDFCVCAGWFPVAQGMRGPQGHSMGGP